ncbi:hypothetical protein GCK32_005593, partial [Trichostrongylus colubriformis]
STGLLKDPPSYIIMYGFFLLMKVALMVMVVYWNCSDATGTRSTLAMTYDEELPIISDLPMTTTPAKTRADEKAKAQ